MPEYRAEWRSDIFKEIDEHHALLGPFRRPYSIFVNSTEIGLGFNDTRTPIPQSFITKRKFR